MVASTNIAEQRNTRPPATHQRQSKCKRKYARDLIHPGVTGHGLQMRRFARLTWRARGLHNFLCNVRCEAASAARIGRLKQARAASIARHSGAPSTDTAPLQRCIRTGRRQLRRIDFPISWRNTLGCTATSWARGMFHGEASAGDSVLLARAVHHQRPCAPHRKKRA